VMALLSYVGLLEMYTGLFDSICEDKWRVCTPVALW